MPDVCLNGRDGHARTNGFQAHPEARSRTGVSKVLCDHRRPVTATVNAKVKPLVRWRCGLGVVEVLQEQRVTRSAKAGCEFAQLLDGRHGRHRRSRSRPRPRDEYLWKLGMHWPLLRVRLRERSV